MCYRPFSFSALCLMLLAFVLSYGCLAPEKRELPPAETFYNQALEQLADDEPAKAKTLLNSLREAYPFSKYATRAEILLADILYEEEEYLAAAESYKLFEDSHPAHESAAYALFRLGQCWLNMTTSEDRDLTSAHKALNTFTKLRAVHPDSEYAARSLEKTKNTLELIAQHELYVAKFYIRTEKLASALGRLKGLLEKYPETQAAEEAKPLLVQLEGDL